MEEIYKALDVNLEEPLKMEEQAKNFQHVAQQRPHLLNLSEVTTEQQTFVNGVGSSRIPATSGKSKKTKRSKGQKG